jgi:hypothetical protein
MSLKDEIRDFLAAGVEARASAAQLVALQCLCGIDLVDVMKADLPRRAAALGRIARMLERERMKGLAGHWAYDLNRHIALKQAADRLRGIDAVPPAERQRKAKRRPRGRR